MIGRIERTLVAALAVASWPLGATAQVQTEVPAVVEGAKPVAVERIKHHTLERYGTCSHRVRPSWTPRGCSSGWMS